MFREGSPKKPVAGSTMINIVRTTMHRPGTRNWPMNAK